MLGDHEDRPLVHLCKLSGEKRVKGDIQVLLVLFDTLDNEAVAAKVAVRNFSIRILRRK